MLSMSTRHDGDDDDDDDDGDDDDDDADADADDDDDDDHGYHMTLTYHLSLYNNVIILCHYLSIIAVFGVSKRGTP